MNRKTHLFNCEIDSVPVFLSPTITNYNIIKNNFIIEPPPLDLNQNLDDELSEDENLSTSINENYVNEKNLDFSIISLNEEDKKNILKENQNNNVKIPLDTNKGILKFIDRSITKISRILKN